MSLKKVALIDQLTLVEIPDLKVLEGVRGGNIFSASSYRITSYSEWRIREGVEKSLFLQICQPSASLKAEDNTNDVQIV